MDLSESFDFLAKFWDKCEMDPDISDVINGNNDIIGLQKKLFNSFFNNNEQNNGQNDEQNDEQNSQQKDEQNNEQNSQQNDEQNNQQNNEQNNEQKQFRELVAMASDIKNFVLPISELTKESLKSFQNAQKKINNISHVNDFINSEVEQRKKSIQDAKDFFILVEMLKNPDFKRYPKGSDRENFYYFDQLLKLSRFFSSERIKKNYPEQTALVSRRVGDILPIIKNQMKSAFYNNLLSNDAALELTHKYYDYILKLSRGKLENSIELQNFKNECIDSVINSLLHPLFGSGKFDNLKKKAVHLFNEDIFDFNYDKIQQICKMISFDPRTLPPISKNEPIEIKIVYFIFMLPQTIERRIYELSQVFGDKTIYSKFLAGLKQKYFDQFNTDEIFVVKKNISNGGMFWSFIYSIIALHGITFNASTSNKIYNDFVLSIIEHTCSKSLSKANSLYETYTDSCPLITRFQKWDENEMAKYDENKLQQNRDKYSLSYIRILNDEVKPVFDCLSLLYFERVKYRKNFAYKWYGKMLDKFVDNKWFTDYVSFIQVKFVDEINPIVQSFDDKNVYLMFCMEHYLLKSSEDFVSHCLDGPFNEVIGGKAYESQSVDVVSLDQSRNIGIDEVMGIINGFRQLSFDNIVKYLSIYARASALYIRRIIYLVFGSGKGDDIGKYFYGDTKILKQYPIADMIDNSTYFLISHFSSFITVVARKKHPDVRNFNAHKFADDVSALIKQAFDTVK